MNDFLFRGEVLWTTSAMTKTLTARRTITVGHILRWDGYLQ